MALMGWGLTGVYVASLLPALLGNPPLSPNWLSDLSKGLVDQGPLALLGLALLHLSAYLNADDRTIERRFRLAAQLALAAALGFVLLIPLQAMLLWPSLQNPASLEAKADQKFKGEFALAQGLLAQNLQSPQLRIKLLERVAALRQTVGLPAIAGNESLYSAPSDALRNSLTQQLAEIETQKGLNRERAAAAPGGRPTRLNAISSALRTMLTSLALAIGFLAGSRRRSEDLSPLLIWQLNRELRHSGSRNTPRSGSRQADRQFISQLSPDDPPTT